MKLTFAVLLLIASAPVVMAQGGTWTQIDYPGALETACTGIDSFGNVVGWYQGGDDVYGFILSNGTFTSVALLDNFLTEFNGINDLGQIVGYSGGGGFVYNWPTQTFTEGIGYPDSDWTVPYGINNAGTIIGAYQTNDIYEDAFMLSGSTYTQLRPPDLEYAEDFSANGITTSGWVVLSVRDYGNYIYKNGNYKKIPISNRYADATGVNPAGTEIVGCSPINEEENEVGFLYRNDAVTEMKFPGANSTCPNSVNDSGVIVGSFTVSGSISSHGFTWTRPADAPKK